MGKLNSWLFGDSTGVKDFVFGDGDVFDADEQFQGYADAVGEYDDEEDY